jgi:hypothetical protein
MHIHAYQASGSHLKNLNSINAVHELLCILLTSSAILKNGVLLSP